MGLMTFIMQNNERFTWISWSSRLLTMRRMALWFVSGDARVRANMCFVGLGVVGCGLGGCEDSHPPNNHTPPKHKQPPPTPRMRARIALQRKVSRLQALTWNYETCGILSECFSLMYSTIFFGASKFLVKLHQNFYRWTSWCNQILALKC